MTDPFHGSPSDAAQQAVAALSPDDQIALLSGLDGWHTVSLTGIPTIKVTDGPIGARGDSTTGEKAVCLPAPIAQAASFDTGLVSDIGRLLGRETMRKGAQVLLAPTINIARHPLGGRNFESFGEEPMLVAAMGAAFITGVQDEGVAACAKHLVANDVEWNRLIVSSEVDEATLREAYLTTFEAAVHAGVLTVMSAYPKLNGTHCSEHRWLLTTVLRDEWGFDGLVMSDWGATHAAADSINAGLDLEMPGPALALGQRLAEAVEAGEVSAEQVAKRAINIAELAVRTGGLDRQIEPERSVDDPDERALARRAAADGMVLVSNIDALLPFDPAISALAVIGPNADPGVAQGGGSAEVLAHHEVSPLEGIRAALPQAEVSHRPGCLAHRYLPPAEAGRWDGPIALEIFGTAEPQGEPLITKGRSKIEAFVSGTFDAVPDPSTYSWRWTGRLPITESGDHLFSVFAIGRSRVFVNGDLVADNWTSPRPGKGYFEKASDEVVGVASLQANSTAEVVVEWSRGHDDQFVALRFGYLPPVDEDALMDEAVAAAEGSERAVVVVGLNAEWETESHDRDSLDLPGRQNELVARVLAVQPDTVVVVNAGSPVAMPWLDEAPATLLVWYPGQEGGSALADVLFGHSDPGGRLPITIPRQLSDAPSAASVPSGSDRAGQPPSPVPEPKLRYDEKLFIGHRGYDRSGIAPLVPFGHGLSYATFTFGDAKVVGEPSPLREPAMGAGARVEVAVTNTAARAGKCVIQIYLRPDAPDRPRVLAGFAAATIDPGATTVLTAPIADRALQRWDSTAKAWRPIVGEHLVEIATSSIDTVASSTIAVGDR